MVECTHVRPDRRPFFCFFFKFSFCFFAIDTTKKNKKSLEGRIPKFYGCVYLQIGESEFKIIMNDSIYFLKSVKSINYNHSLDLTFQCLEIRILFQKTIYIYFY